MINLDNYQKKIDAIFTPKRTKILVFISLIIFFVSYFVMNYFHALAGDPVKNVFVSQLSFSGEFMKNQYAGMGDLDYYRLVAITDYGFMVGYGFLIFSLALTISRKFLPDSIWCRIGYILATFGLIAACLDAIENAFILAMLTDPSGFPNSWAITHSSFALVKWSLGFIAVVYIIIATCYYLVNHLGIPNDSVAPI